MQYMFSDKHDMNASTFYVSVIYWKKTLFIICNYTKFVCFTFLVCNSLFNHFQKSKRCVFVQKAFENSVIPILTKTYVAYHEAGLF